MHIFSTAHLFLYLWQIKNNNHIEGSAIREAIGSGSISLSSCVATAGTTLIIGFVLESYYETTYLNYSGFLWFILLFVVLTAVIMCNNNFTSIIEFHLRGMELCESHMKWPLSNHGIAFLRGLNHILRVEVLLEIKLSDIFVLMTDQINFEFI